MGVMNVGPGWAYVRNGNGISIPVGVLEEGTAGPFQLEQKFVGGAFQLDEYCANTGLKVGGKLGFKALDLSLMLGVGLSQYSTSSGELSDLPVIESPLTIATSTIAVTGATAVLSVRNPITGVPLKQVATAPSADQYSVSGTTITLNSTQATAWVGLKPLVTYLKVASTDTSKVNLLNAVMQEAVYFGVTGFGSFSGKATVYNFIRCAAKSIPLFDGKADYAKRELDYTVLSDPYLHTFGSLTVAESLA